jgi:hypothetical protein
MTQTYNPILETTELPRFRLGPVRAPAMGTVLVVERAVGEPLVIHHGERIPDARTGNYRRMYLIDVANRGLAFTVEAPSSDAAFPFTVTVRCGCRVIDSVAIASDRVRDMTAALSPSLARVVREVASRFDVMDPAAVETAITASLNSARLPPAIELTGFSVIVNVVDAAEIITERRRIRVQEMRRDAMRPVASGSREDMLAHLMAIDEGSPMAWIDRERADREAHTQAQLSALRIVMGETTEDFDAADVRKQALSEFFPGAGPSIPAKHSGIRERLEKKSARGSLERGPVVEADVPAKGSKQAGETGRDSPDQADPGPADPSSNGHRPSRLRGTMGSPRSATDR